MKIKNGFMVRKVGGQNVVVAVGDTSRSFNGIIRLNDSGRYIWEKLQGGIETEQLIRDMRSDFNIDEETARKDAAAFIAKIQEAGLLE